MKQNLLIAFLLAITFGLSAQFDASDYKIAFLTKDIDSTGTLDEQVTIDDLRSRGFQVDFTYSNPAALLSSGLTPDFEFSFDALEDYDLVIIGRGVSSGDFQDAEVVENWSNVQAPVLIFSTYLMRSSRLKLINNSRAGRAWVGENNTPPITGDSLDRATVYTAAINTDNPLSRGVDLDMDGEIGFHTWFHDYIGVKADTFEMSHNASLIASWIDDNTLNWGGTVAAAHWAAGVETYPGGVTVAGQRGFIAMGSDDRADPRNRNYFAFTDESTIIYHNMIKQLVGASPDGQEIPVLFDPTNVKIAFITKDIDSTGTLNEQGLISDLKQRGFTVDFSYNNATSLEDNGLTADFEFSYDALEDYDLVILGRGVSSGDFNDAEDWATVTTPIITFSPYLMRSSRLKLVNTTTAGRGWVGENASPPIVGADFPRDTVYNVRINRNSSVFNGVDSDMDGEIGYHTWFRDYLGYGADTFELNHNATLLASWIDDAPVNWNNAVAVAHWESGVETYPGGVMLAGPRAIFTMGSDDRDTPRERNFTAFTDESTIVFHNLIQLLLGFEPNGVEIPFSGPAVRYSFEGSGDMVDDGIGGANGLILNGNGITREACGVNNSINFAGSTKPDAIITVEDNAAINFDGSSSFSISLWAKIDPFTNLAEMNLLLKGDNRNDGTHLPNGNGHWYAIATKDNELRLALDDDITKSQLGVLLDDTAFPPTQWNHIVGVVDTDQDSLYLYLNGNLIGSILNETDADMSTTGLPLVIGNYHSGVRKINGSLDEVEIFNRALSASAIAEMYNNASINDNCTIIETITEVSDDATLSSLSVNIGTLQPEFDPAIPNYSVEVPAGTSSITITASANNPNATLTGDGLFTNIPGTATISVTAEDAVSTRDYNISISVQGQGGTRILVEPGFGTLFDAINAANAGDTLVLKNGESYSPLENYQINKTIVIIAEEIPSLPALANMPIIDNIFGTSPIFQMNFGGNLTLIGIDVNGGGAANIINCQGDLGVPSVSSIYINRCRLHNTTEDILNDARDANVDMTQLERCIVRNTFVYDSGGGHGLYVKNYFGESTFIFENLTFWNLGQQFNWIRHYPAGITQSFVYDHLTGYNLSTDVGADKELFGNSDATTEAALDIQLKNSIFHTQVSMNEGSLKFDNRTEQSTITTNNNVLFQVQPIVDIGGTINHVNNQIGTDPQFQDPANGDFTVLNEALWDAADDGEIVGALYWLPGYIDDFSDLNPTSTKDLNVLRFDFKAYPNPFTNRTHFSFHLDNTAEVSLKIFDLMGREIKTVVDEKMGSGDHRLEVSTDHLLDGVYIYRFVSNGAIIANKMIKSSK